MLSFVNYILDNDNQKIYTANFFINFIQYALVLLISLCLYN